MLSQLPLWSCDFFYFPSEAAWGGGGRGLKSHEASIYAGWARFGRGCGRGTNSTNPHWGLVGEVGAVFPANFIFLYFILLYF